MAVERRSPLPPGRYWFDAVERDWPKADAWRSANAKTVKIERVEQTAKSSSSPATRWTLFRVLEPTPWDKRLGFPTIASQDVKQRSDTATNPPTPGLLDEFPPLSSSAVATIAPLVALAVIAIVISTKGSTHGS